MEIKVSRSEFLKGLTLIQGIVEKRTTMPILTNVLIEATNKQVQITATDLEVGINGTYGADVINNGKITLHAKSLYDIIREFPDEVVHIKVLDGNWVEATCQKSQFKIVGLSPDEFPTLPNKGTGETRKLKGEVITSMIEKVSFAMSTDETRYNLNGVYLDTVTKDGKTKLRMVATDGHRLSIVERDVDGGWKAQKGMIIPRKGVMELLKLAEGENTNIEVWIDTKHIIAYKDNITLVVRLIEGQFPPFEQVVPKTTKKIVSVEKTALESALRRVSILSSDKTRGVKFSFSSKNLDIFASNPGLGEAREEIPTKYKGEHFEIGFNARYVLDAIHVMDDEEIVMQLSDETAPCLLKSEKDMGFTHVIMPMRL